MHCVLVKTDGLLLLRDLGSTNGTRVNGARVRRAALLPNDQVSIANYKFRVFLGPDAPAAAGPPHEQPSSSTLPRRPSCCAPAAPKPSFCGRQRFDPTKSPGSSRSSATSCPTSTRIEGRGVVLRNRNAGRPRRGNGYFLFLASRLFIHF